MNGQGGGVFALVAAAAGCAMIVMCGGAGGAAFFVLGSRQASVAPPPPIGPAPTYPPPSYPPPSYPAPAVPAPAPPAGTARRVPVEGAPVQGPRDALVTIVVFSDFECPFCSRVVPTLARVREAYPQDVRIVFRHNPLPFHRHAAPAARAAIEVFRQRGDEAFFRMHDILFENRSALEDADLVRYASQVGADPARVQAALGGATHSDVITADQELARGLGATGTPSFFINGQPLRGAQPYESFATLIDAELARAQALVAQGVPREQVYDAVMAGAISP